MVDSTARYVDAITTAFSNLHHYHHYNWENLGADGYADAIEGMLSVGRIQALSKDGMVTGILPAPRSCIICGSQRGLSFNRGETML
jgi:hypothetical protein